MLFLEVAMKQIQRLLHYFTKFEIGLWTSSVVLITVFFFAFDRTGYMTFVASLIGATALIFNAKGNPLGQFLVIIFSVFYGIISYTFAYYGEMITYLGMTAPMALVALITWLRNPYQGNKAEVTVNHITRKEVAFMAALTVVVTIMFYFILAFFHTANLLPSTLSVTTTFIAVYLTFRRSSYFTLAYAVNDLVLIILWALAAMTDLSYLSVMICFVVFFVNDLYGFINWLRMEKRQNAN